jgi:hypothetical protein
MNNAKTLAILALILVNAMIAQAVIIESTEANQYEYKNGDVIIIDMDTNAPGLEINADFSKVDSNYDARMVRIDEDADQYQIIYPISYANNKGDAEYNAVLTAYDPATSTTSSVTYGIILKNAGQRQIDEEDLTINIINGSTPDEITDIDILDGYIQICRPRGCELLTEQEYETSRQVIINNGTVQLSDMTYDQLKTQIENQLSADLKEELKVYLDQITQINKLLDERIYKLNELVVQQQNNTNETINRTEELIKKGNRNNLLAILAVIIVVGGGLYTLYLRTETTWFTGPR